MTCDHHVTAHAGGLALVAGHRVRASASRGQQPSPAQQPQQQHRVEVEIAGRRRPRATPCPTSSPHAGRGGGGKDNRASPVGRPRLRARVLPHPARHLLLVPAGAFRRGGPVRRVARARRRRSLRHGAAHRQRGPCPGAPLQRRSQRSVFAKEYNGPARNPALRPHHCRRDPPAAARAAAASRAPSWRSSRIATGSGPTGPIEQARRQGGLRRRLRGANQRRITTRR